MQDRFAAAERHLLRGAPARALDGYLRLLADRLAAHTRAGTPLAAADIVVAERLADLAVLFGEQRAADGLLQGMADALAQGGNRAGADYASLKRAHVALAGGRVRSAGALLRTVEHGTGGLEEIDFTPAGLAYWEATRGWCTVDGVERAVLFTHFYLAAGGVLTGLGAYAPAECALRRGMEHAGEGAPELARLAAAPLELALAAALLERGALDAARALLAGTAGLDPRETPGLVVRRLELCSRLYLLRGELGSALQGLRAVARLCADGGYPAAAGRARLNLAHALIVLNQTQAARELLKTARRHGRAAGDAETAARAEWLLRVASARGQSLAPRVSSAIEMWGRERGGRASRTGDVPELPEPESHLSLLDDLALAFHWALGRHDWAAAARRLEEARDVFAGCDSEVVSLRLALLAAVLAYYQGDRRGAGERLARLVPRLRALGLKADEWQAQRFLHWSTLHPGRPEGDARAAAERAAALLDELTESLAAPDQVFFLLNKWTAEEEVLAGEVAALVRRGTRGRRPWSPGRRWSLAGGIHRLLERMDQHRGQIARRGLRGEPASPEGADPARLPLWRRLLTHPRDRVTLAFLVLPDRVVTVVSGWMRLDIAQAPITRVRLREMVRAWHSLADARDEDGNPVPDQTAGERAALVDEMSAALGLPALLRRLPRRVRALTLVADDALHGFPFAAVRHQGRYLVEDYALHFTFSTAPRPAGRSGIPRRKALLAGVAEAAGGLRDLPQVPVELDALQALLEGRGVPCVRLDEQAGCPASRRAVLAALPRAELFHAACHGTFHPDRPDLSGLLLHPEPGAPTTLSLRDVSELRLDGVRHVTLSACWCADSYVLPGRWIVSLPEAFCRAGAGSVLASLWEVEDTVGRSVQSGFYTGLAAGLPRDQALRRVQVDALEGRLAGCEGPWTADPLWWAGLRLYGDPGPLVLAPG